MHSPESAPPLFVLAVILSAGLIGGELVARTRLPRVTGWILTGILLGQLELRLLAPPQLHALAPFLDFTLGLIAFTVGSQLNLRRLRNAGRRLGLLLLTEATVTPLVILVFLSRAELEWRTALMLVPIAIAGAPAATLSVVSESRARGVFTKTLLASVAIIDMVAICLFETFHWGILEGTPPGDFARVLPMLPRTLGVVAWAALIGTAAAAFTLAIDRRIVARRLLGISLVAAILLCWSVAQAMGRSSILACTFLGVALTNLMKDKEAVGENYLHTFRGLLFTIFFTLAGLHLDFSAVRQMGWVVVLLVVGRLVGKVLSSWTAMRLAGATRNVRRYLGLALVPHGGVAVGLLIALEEAPGIPPDLKLVALSVGLTAIAVDELIGPALTRLALDRTGETGQDRPRLFDFLREEHIVTGFHAETRTEAISSLAHLLVSGRELEIDRHELVQRLLARERMHSTCVGGGLMIPHCTGVGSGATVGVMAVCREGLPFHTPDGEPVRCIVLLVTPPEAVHRHLAILAGLARSLGSETDLRDRVYLATTPAHVYEALQEPYGADFNYYLEEQELAATAWEGFSGRDPGRLTQPGIARTLPPRPPADV